MDTNSSMSLFCATVLYPNNESASFDFELWANTLIPEYVKILGDNVVDYEVRKGLTAPSSLLTPTLDALLCYNNLLSKR